MPAPDNADCAVILTCDARYLPFALHLIRQMIFHCPARQFDILVASEDLLPLPDWALRDGVNFHHMQDSLLPADLPTGRQTRPTYLKLTMPAVLVGRYRRVLCLDCDIFMECGDIDRLLRLPMGDHPVAAVQDVLPFLDPRHHAVEYKAVGLPALPYLNGGVMLIDTAAFVAADLLDRCLAVARDTPQAMRLVDQSMLNVALRGRFAELSPVWNWMPNIRLPSVPRSHAMRFRHFIGPGKPWKTAGHRHEARFAASYAAFFRTMLPEALPLIDPLPRPALIPLDGLVRDLVNFTRQRKTVAAAMARFRDEWDVKL